MFNKKKTQPTKYKALEDKIEYVIKFGYNGAVTKRLACKRLADIDNFCFDKDCNIIEIYRQNSEYYNDITIEVNENALDFKVRLFKGDFIPTLQALQLPCKKTSVSTDYEDEYNNIVSSLVENDASGIISVDGHPYMAKIKDTFAFELDENGKVEKLHNLDSLFLSAESKYQNILDGKGIADVNSKISNRSTQYISKLTTLIRK